MNEIDALLENSFCFEYYGSWTSKCRDRHYEKEHIIHATVLAQLVRGSSNGIINGRRYNKPEGTVTMLPPGTLSGSDVRGKLLVFRGMKFNFLLGGGINLLSLYSFPFVFDMNSSLRLGRKIAQLVKCHNLPDKLAAAVRRKKIAWSICEDILPFAKKKTDFERILSGMSRLNKVFAHIREKLPGNISIEELAGTANLSISRFHVLFRETTGFSPHEYILREKLKLAGHLLKTSDKTLSEISIETGFYDHYHLGKQFKKMFGIPPGQYRYSDDIM